MTATPQAESDDQVPAFAIVIRGYDRDQVDEYLSRHEAWVRDWRQRASAAEAAAAKAQKRVGELTRQVAHLEQRTFTSTPESFEALGDQVGGILKAAFDAAQTMRSEAEAETTALRDRADQEASSLRAKSQSEVRSMKEAAEGQIKAKRAALNKEIRALVERRDSVITHLGSLQRDLATLLGSGRSVEELAQNGPETDVVDLRDGPGAERAVPAETR